MSASLREIVIAKTTANYHIMVHHHYLDLLAALFAL
jgi:hypothetical protein